jgi:putative toxin-antitoxin system antitoxin component (TIGR02293 family)
MSALEYKQIDPATLDGDIENVAVKSLRRVFEFWKINAATSARLAGMSKRTWDRIKAEQWSGRLNQDQLMRASALIGVYKALHLYFSDELADQWVTRPNSGPLFQGHKPVDMMEAGGLPAILQVRDYIDAVRGGL